MDPLVGRIELQIQQIAKRHRRRLIALSFGLIFVYGLTFLSCLLVRELLVRPLPDGASNVEVCSTLSIAGAVTLLAYVLIKRVYSIRCPTCSARCRMRLLFQDANLYCENADCDQVIQCDLRF